MSDEKPTTTNPTACDTLQGNPLSGEVFQAGSDRPPEEMVTQILGGLGLQLPQAGTGPSAQSPNVTALDTQESWAVEVPHMLLGRYRVRGEIGRGGMGRVLLAEDPELGRVVAIKILLDPSSIHHDHLQRFVAEARITSQLEHPNIIPVHDLGVTDEGQLYFVMKRVVGHGLDQVILELAAGKPETTEHWTRRRLLTTFVQLCNAVGYAHERGVLHRDLKPANVMLGRFGEVMLMDWGVARLLKQLEDNPPEDDPVVLETITLAPNTTGNTLEGATVGTPGFLAPEQAYGDFSKLGPFSDVWSLGAILYELITYKPAFVGTSAIQLLYEAAQSSPEDPRVRAPQLSVPDEIAEICLRSLARLPQDRFHTALELGEAVEAFLEGSRRKEAAGRHVASADRSWSRYRGLEGERNKLASRVKLLSETIPTWASLAEKAEVLSSRGRLDRLGEERGEMFERVVSSCEQALTHDPGNPGAHSLLAQVHYSRFEETERRGDLEGMRAAERRVRRYDDGSFAPLIRGIGAVTLRTDPPGTDVLCQEFLREGLVWQLGPARSLGHTPLIRIPMEKGSYLLTLRRTGKRDTLYPVFIGRGVHWDSGPSPIPIFSDSDIGKDYVYVPAGPFVAGGDPTAPGALDQTTPWEDGFFMARSPVTMQTWSEFINAIHVDDEDTARSRLPRFDKASPYWDFPEPGEPYVVPEVDRDGDSWNPDFPVFGISWQDALAFSEWKSARERRPLGLPTERQWEKSARGVDGRFFPWGDRFDASLCKMTGSRERTQHAATNVEAIGSFPADRSVYRVADLAGTIREWCVPSGEDSGQDLGAARGGSWYASKGAACRAAARSLHNKWTVYTSVGLRLTCDLPVPTSTLD